MNFKSILFLPLILLFVFGTAGNLSAQKKFKACGKKCKAVRISDPGEIYSTYEFSSEEEDQIMKITSEACLSKVLDAHTEDTWPSKMQELDDRIANEDKTKMYKVFLLCEFGDGKNVLVVPAKLNKKMPEGYAPEADFYIVIGDSGIEK